MIWPPSTGRNVASAGLTAVAGVAARTRTPCTGAAWALAALLLLAVPGFEGVRIHPGNTAADTEGCLLPGRVRLGKSVGQSVLAFNDLFARINDAQRRRELVTIDIFRAPAP